MTFFAPCEVFLDSALSYQKVSSSENMALVYHLIDLSPNSINFSKSGKCYPPLDKSLSGE